MMTLPAAPHYRRNVDGYAGTQWACERCETMWRGDDPTCWYCGQPSMEPLAYRSWWDRLLREEPDG